MGSNKIENLASADSTDDAMPKTDIQSSFVDEAGDTMGGDLKLGGYDIKNVDSLDNGTARTLELGSNGDVNIPNGNLKVGENQIQNIGTARTNFTSNGDLRLNDGARVEFVDTANNNLHYIQERNNQKDLKIGNTYGGTNPFITIGQNANLVFDGEGGTGRQFSIEAEAANADGINLGVTGTGSNEVQINETGLTAFERQGTRVMTLKDGGNVEIPNGNLNMSKNNIEIGPNTDYKIGYQTSQDDFTITDAGGDYLDINGGLNRMNLYSFALNMHGNDLEGVGNIQTDASTTSLSLGSGGDVEIPNGNLDVSGSGRFNSLVGDSSGSQCGSNEFVNGNGNCEVDTDTDTSKGEDEVESDIFDTGDNNQGNLGLNGNNLTNVNSINGQDVGSLGGDGYIGNSGPHTAGGDLDMNGNEIRNANATQSFQIPVGTDAY